MKSTKTKKKALQQLLKPWKFDYINSDITDENFPWKEPRSPEYRLFDLGRGISSEGAIAEMRREGYEPATLQEMLLWDSWNGEDWTVALGSVVELRGDRCVPCLYRHGSWRALNLGRFDDGWSAPCRFLAVRTGTGSIGSQESPLGSSEPMTLEAAIEKVKGAGYRVIREM